MGLTGQAKKDYQREYMRKKRSKKVVVCATTAQGLTTSECLQRTIENRNREFVFAHFVKPPSELPDAMPDGEGGYVYKCFGRCISCDVVIEHWGVFEAIICDQCGGQIKMIPKPLPDAPDATLEALNKELRVKSLVRVLKGGRRAGMSGLLPLDKKLQAGKERM